MPRVLRQPSNRNTNWPQYWRGDRGHDAPHVGFGARHFGSRLSFQEVRNSNGGEDGDNRYDDEQLNQGKSFAIHLRGPFEMACCQERGA
jgi:hypothetical protein